jgi:hypothetical protein
MEMFYDGTLAKFLSVEVGEIEFGRAGNTATNTGQVQFPTCTGGSATATHWSLGRLGSGAGQVLYKGALSSSLSISNNITPQFAASALSVTED